jgi:hypothetical protein
MKNGQNVKSVICRGTSESAAGSLLVRRRRKRVSRGQSAVEFALISVVVLMIMLVGSQPRVRRTRALCIELSRIARRREWKWHDQWRLAARGGAGAIIQIHPHQRRQRSECNGRFLSGNLNHRFHHRPKTTYTRGYVRCHSHLHHHQ